jgi:PKD domain protein
LQNDSYGADEYEWTSEGDSRSSSRAKQPGVVTFAEAGERTDLRVDSALFFFVEPHQSKYQMNPKYLWRQYLELHLELAKETSISKNNR